MEREARTPRSRRGVLGLLAAGLSASTAGCTAVEALWSEDRDPGRADGRRSPPGPAAREPAADAPRRPTPRPAADVGVATTTDVAYRDTDAGELRLDLTRARDDVRRPVLLHVHGGGWRRGEKGYEHAERVARAGLAVASVEYRLSGEARFPAAVRDVVAAIGWLREHAADRGLDGDRIALVGESAGAHLAALAATAGDEQRFRPDGREEAAEDDPGGDAPVDDVASTNSGAGAASVDALVGVSGIYDLTPEPRCTASVTEDFLGGTCEERPEDARAGSPVRHVDGTAPPTLLFHGRDDDVVAFEQATAFRDALAAAGVPAELHAPDDAGHLLGEHADAFLERQTAFLAEHLNLARS